MIIIMTMKVVTIMIAIPISLKKMLLSIITIMTIGVIDLITAIGTDLITVHMLV